MKKIIVFALTAIFIVSLCAVFVSAEATNVAAGKAYTFTGLYTDNAGNIPYPDTGNKELTDGIVGSSSADVGYGVPLWIGLNTGGANANATDMTNEIIVNLGSSTTGITNFKLYAEECGGGISAPVNVEVLVSSDNTNFQSIGTATGEFIINANDSANPTFGIYEYALAASSEQTVQYVKFIVKHKANWAFVSEVEVYTGGETGDPVSEDASEDVSAVSEADSEDDTSPAATDSVADDDSEAVSADESKAEDGMSTGVIIIIVAVAVVVIGGGIFIATKKK